MAPKARGFDFDKGSSSMDGVVLMGCSGRGGGPEFCGDSDNDGSG